MEEPGWLAGRWIGWLDESQSGQQVGWLACCVACSLGRLVYVVGSLGRLVVWLVNIVFAGR